MSSIHSSRTLHIATIETEPHGLCEIHNAPTASSAVVDRVQDGETLVVLDKQGDWCLVRRGDTVGYVRCEYIVLHY